RPGRTSSVRRSVVISLTLVVGVMVTTSPAVAADGPPSIEIAHSLPTGGMNLWEAAVADGGSDQGLPSLATTLESGGFRYILSRTMTGNFGDVSGQDDGSSDTLVVHHQPNGGLLFWVVGGGDPAQTPRVWYDL